MKAAFDNSFLTLLFNPKAHSSVPKAAELVDDLVTELDQKKAKIIIPAPTLTELLIKIPKSGPITIEKVKAYSCFQIKPFDEKSAIELAETLIASIGKKRSRRTVAKMKITFDRQIVAVAKAHGATQMYSDDKEVRDFSDECGLEAYTFTDLKLSPKQQKLPYDKKEEQSVSSSAEVSGGRSGSSEGQAGVKAGEAKTKKEN